MATSPPNNPTDDLNNYTQPAATTDLTKFTGTGVANTAEKAQELAIQNANKSAIQQYGENTTAFGGFNETRVKITGETPPYTYTATHATNAYQVEPPSVSGLSPAEQQAFLLANQGPRGEAQLTLDQQKFLEANGGFEPQTVSEPTREQVAFLEANGVFNPPPVTGEPSPTTESLERQKFLEANVGPQAPEIDPNQSPDVTERLRRQAEATAARPSTDPSVGQNTQTGVNLAQSSGGNKPTVLVNPYPDYRVRLSLAPSANYLYKDPAITPQHILYPLIDTQGVLFPYTPIINVAYTANYEGTDLTHSNYRIYNYRNSSIENLSITADFTAQDQFEANYVLAVIHFFRSVTKMFYGKDENPNKGIPPPLVYLTGHGTYGFDNHPAVVNSFTLNYPNEVDYIDAGTQVNTLSYNPPSYVRSTTTERLRKSKLRPGGLAPAPVFTQSAKQPPVTRIPTKLQITIGLYPIITRYNMSNNFSLKKYASGELLRGSVNVKGGGVW